MQVCLQMGYPQNLQWSLIILPDTVVTMAIGWEAHGQIFWSQDQIVGCIPITSPVISDTFLTFYGQYICSHHIPIISPLDSLSMFPYIWSKTGPSSPVTSSLPALAIVKVAARPPWIAID